VSGRLVAGGESFGRERRGSGRGEARRGRSLVERRGALSAWDWAAERSLRLRVRSAWWLLQREISASARLVRRPNRRRACPTIDLTMSRENQHPCGQLTTRTPLWRRPRGPIRALSCSVRRSLGACPAQRASSGDRSGAGIRAKTPPSPVLCGKLLAQSESFKYAGALPAKLPAATTSATPEQRTPREDE